MVVCGFKSWYDQVISAILTSNDIRNVTNLFSQHGNTITCFDISVIRKDTIYHVSSYVEIKCEKTNVYLHTI